MRNKSLLIIPNTLRSIVPVFIVLSLIMGVDASVSSITDSKILHTLSPHAMHLKLKPDELQALAAGQIIAREIPASNSKEMAAFGAMLAEAEPQNFIEAFRTLAIFNQSQSVIAYRRFSATPVLDDLAGLTIKDKDLLELMRARVGDSDVKLTEADIARIQNIHGRPFSQQVVVKLTAEYKQILLDKVKAYAVSGAEALGAYADQEVMISAKDVSARMLRYQSYSAKQNEQLCNLLLANPEESKHQAESFYYWAVQKFGQLKPVISLVHVMIYSEGPRVFIASKQIYSSHYTEAGLGVAELIPFIDPHGQRRTLAAYTIRLQVDMLGGTTGFIKKRLAQPRMTETLKESLQGLRNNVESSHRVAASDGY